MIINYTFMLILSIHLTISTVSANNLTSISNSETQILQSSGSAPLAEPVIQVKDDQQKFKLNKKGERVLNRGIAPTNLNSIIANNNSSNSSVSKTKNNNNNETQAITIVTEGSGVSKINLKNDTIAIAVAGHKVNSTKIPATITTTKAPTPPPIVLNATEIKSHETKANNSATTSTKLTIVPQNKTSVVVKTSTSTTTTTTTTSTTTTTPKPKKPQVTYSVEDMPGLDKVIPGSSASSSSNNKFPSETKSSAPKLSVEEPEIPHVQPSQEFDGGLYRNHRDYIIPIVSIIFAVPILMGMVIVAYRRFRDFWSTRHYRRMDFLVDGMYND